MYTDVLVLGAGLSGLSTAYHTKGNSCLVLEANSYAGGHVYTDVSNGFYWDEGPHVSFTKHKYVKDLFSDSVDNSFLEFPVSTANYYHGTWIPHPAQTNLFAIPSPLRDQCLEDFLSQRAVENELPISNYEEWLIQAFGEAFYNNFSKIYTEKYWTCHPKELGIDWVGNRVHYPNIQDVKDSFFAPLDKPTHYITSIRYPTTGGFCSYTNKLKANLNIRFNSKVVDINLSEKRVSTQDGGVFTYGTLVSTLPLPNFLALAKCTDTIQSYASNLKCTSVLLLNFELSHLPIQDYHWMYVYDADKFSTRINYINKLSPNNSPNGKSGIQVEVYYSPWKPLSHAVDVIIERVTNELIEMNLVSCKEAVENVHIRDIKWANVVVDLDRADNLKKIYDHLSSSHGYSREFDELHPMTDWNCSNTVEFGDLIFAGRFAQWKYFWTDDCVQRGKQIGDYLSR